ncbi:MAG: hypothetical protein AAF657_15555, partial [Acidobacteriota bacterium]
MRLVTSMESVQLPEAATTPSLRLIVSDPGGPLKVPPQKLERFDGFSTTTPAGSLSVKSIKKSPKSFAELSMVKVSVLLSLISISGGMNCFLKSGGSATVRVALAGALTPAREVRGEVMFSCKPVTELVTSRLIEHPGPVTVPLINSIVRSSETSTSPPQLFSPTGGVVKRTPSGKISRKLSSVTEMLLPVLSIKKIKVLLVPGRMTASSKRLLKPSSSNTVRSARAGPLLPMVEVRSPLLFSWVRGSVLVTATLTVHNSPAGTAPSLYSISELPGIAVKVPPRHVGGAVTPSMVTPVGRISWKPSIIAFELLSLLSISNVRVEASPLAITSGSKRLLKPSGRTVKMALAVELPPAAEVKVLVFDRLPWLVA